MQIFYVGRYRENWGTREAKVFVCRQPYDTNAAPVMRNVDKSWRKQRITNSPSNYCRDATNFPCITSITYFIVRRENNATSAFLKKLRCEPANIGAVKFDLYNCNYSVYDSPVILY